MKKADADGSSDGDLVSRRLEGPGLLIDSEDDNAVGALVGDQAERARRIDVEVTRRFDVGGLVFDERERPFGRVDAVNGDTVVPPVRAVQELSVRVHADLGARTRSFEVARKRWDRLNLRQSARSRIVGKGGHRGMEFVNHIGVFAVGAKGEVPRPGAGLDLGERRIVGGNRSVFRIELVDHNLVETEIGHEGEAVIGADVDRMGVRAFLTPGINARSFVLDEAGRFG